MFSLEKQYKNSMFEQIYNRYLEDLSKSNLVAQSQNIGVEYAHGQLLIPMFHKLYQVSSKAVLEKDNPDRSLSHAEVVVLCKYVLLGKKDAQKGESWVSYRDFRDAAPFAGAFATNVERAIAESFANKLDLLKRAGDFLGGWVPELDLAYDLIFVFKALPKVDLLLLFNDADEEFPSECSVLFPDNASEYLDMECLAIIGWLLADYLCQGAGVKKSTLM